MEDEVRGYLTEFGILREQISSAVLGLDDAAANWHPLAEDTNSIYAILAHLIGSQNFWVRQVIDGQVIQRDREAEFRISGRLADILSRWEEEGTAAGVTLGRLGLPQLAETRVVPARPEWGTINVRWCILHLLSHLAMHLGHIQLTRQLLGASKRGN